jgi:hypothetical protein
MNICIGCNKVFNKKQYLERHNLYCIYYNYKKISLSNDIDNEMIRNIIKILFEIENNNIIDDNFIKIKDILNLKIFNNHNTKIQNIYNNIKNLQIDYISYNELMHMVTIHFMIKSDELNLLIQCYKNAKKFNKT